MRLDAFERGLIAIAVIVFFGGGLLVLLEFNKPEITLKKEDWACAKSEPRTRTQTVLVGKVPIPQRITSEVCTQYNRLDD